MILVRGTGWKNLMCSRPAPCRDCANVII
jgi:hypothetical protein